MKKIAWLLVAAALVTGCTDLNKAPVLQEQGESASGRSLGGQVSLVKAFSVYTSHYGIGQTDRAAYIKVKNLGFEKKVSVHHLMADGTWKDFPAQFAEAAEADYEIWYANLSWSNYYMGAYGLGNKFALKYEVNGQTYWDNNSGADYTLNQHEGYILGSGVQVSVRGGNAYRNYYQNNSLWFTGTLDLRNLGYAKKVKVHYTLDNWATVKVAEAAYNTTYHPAYGSPIYSPNSQGVEFWSWGIYTPDSTTLKYAVSYEVGGKTYWDNNNGKNYQAFIQ